MNTFGSTGNFGGVPFETESQLTGNDSPFASELVFVDAGVADYQRFVEAVNPQTEVIILDSQQDGILAINSILAQRNNVATVSIVSHGDQGRVQLGSATLTTDSLGDYQETLQGWSEGLSADADLLFFGCNVAEGEVGRAFVEQLSELTGADIAASDDLTGNKAFGGDWELEVTVGEIESSLPLAESALSVYTGTLASFGFSGGVATFTGDSDADSLVIQLNGSNQIQYNFDSSGFTLLNGGVDISTVTDFNINLGSGFDTVTLQQGSGSWADFGGNFSILAEDITLSTLSDFGMIAGTGNLVFSASDTDANSATASIAITNSIIEAESLTLSAATDVTNLSASGDQTLTNEATVDISGSTLNLTGSFDLSATTTGAVSSSSDTFSIVEMIADGSDGSVVNTINESAIATLTNTTITANAASSLTASSTSSYTAKGLIAENALTGAVMATVDNTVINISGGGLSVTAQDDTALSATSIPDPLVEIGADDLTGGLFDFSSTVASAQNSFDRATQAYVTNSSDLTLGGNLDLSATRDVNIAADTDVISATAASGITTLDISLANSGTFAANEILGDVQAYVDNSNLNVTGDIRLDALDTSAIDARSASSSFSISEDDIGIFNVTDGINGQDIVVATAIAFNAIGFDVDFVSATIDTLLGSSLGTESSVDVQANILNTQINTTGDILVDGIAETVINSTVSNAAETTSDTFFNSNSLSAASILASNKISSTTQALIDNTSATTPTINAGGEVSLNADDSNTIASNTKLVSTASTTNDGGISNLNDLIDDGLNADFSTSDGTTSLGFRDRVRLSADYAVADFDTSNTAATLSTGDFVQVLDGYANGGNQESVYKYIGTATTLDLSTQDYTSGDWVEVGGTAGNVYEYLGSGATLDLSEVDYTDLDFWKEISATTLIPEGNNITASNALAVGGIVVRNEVKNDVEASINAATVTTTDGDVTLLATENATITAEVDSVAEASGGSAYGTGTVIAANGVIATNNILGSANAYIRDSVIDANETSSGLGNVNLSADNTAQITAQTSATTNSGDTAATLVLAFNTVGWEAQDIFTQTIDNLLNTDLGNEATVGVQAYIDTSTLNAEGNVSLDATSQSEIDASISNDATSAASALVNATGMSLGALLASNMVSSFADARLTDATTTVTALGAVSLTATDEARISADNNLKVASATTNDAGTSILNNFISTLESEYEFSTESGTKTVSPFDMVRVSSGTANANLNPGNLYQYIGSSDATINLGTTDFSTDPDWQLFNQDAFASIYPELNYTGSDSVAVGGMVIRNDVRSSVESYITDATVTASTGDLSLTASEVATITAAAEGQASSSGGSAFGTGTSLAINGAIATNLILSNAQTFITNATATATAGSVLLDAQNTSLIDATLLTSLSTGDTAIGGVAAFNTLGWDAQDLVSQTFDAVIGDGFGTENPAQVLAFIEDSTVNAGGEVSVNAVSDALINATNSNTATSEASALFGATGMSVTATLASNKVSTEVNAYIDSNYDYTEDNDLTPDYDLTTLEGLVQSAIDAALDLGFLRTGDTVLVGGQMYEYVGDTISYLQLVLPGGTAALFAADIEWEEKVLNAGDIFKLGTGEVYEYNGSSVNFADISLPDASPSSWTEIPQSSNTINAEGVTVNAEDNVGIFSNIKITASSSTSNVGGADILDGIVGSTITAEFDTSDGIRDLEFGDRVRIADNYDETLGTPGNVYEFLGDTSLGQDIDLTTTDYTDLDLWKEVVATTLIPQGNNISDSDAIAIGGIIVRNEVSGTVDAHINNAIVNATNGDLTVSAIENASIEAIADAAASASGGSAFGDGTVIAGSGVIATNLVLSDANAYLTYSDITATGTGFGNVTVNADNTSTLNAQTSSISESGDTAYAFTLAFNTIGWESQNILTQTIDLLATTDLGDEDPAEVQAYIDGVTLNAAGDVTVTADSQAQLTANMSNEATSTASAFVGATGMAVGGLLTSNLVSSFAKAYIGDDPDDSITSLATVVDAGGAVTIAATDDANIDATSTISAISSTTNDGGISLLNNILNTLLTEYDYSSKSGVQDVEAGEMVRLASDIAASQGVGGDLYQYIGTDTLEGVNLGSIDYDDDANWQLFNDAAFESIYPQLNVTDSDSIAATFVILRNDVRGSVDSFINAATVTAAQANAEGNSISVTVSENASIQAATEGIVSSSGGSSFGTGTSLALNGAVVTNLVLSEANAFMTASDIDATVGNVQVNAQNNAEIDATLLLSLTSGDTAGSVLLAFNTLGWEAQDLLTRTLDLVLSTSIGDEQPISVNAFIENADVQVDAGSLSVTATNTALMNATVSNSAVSTASALFGASSLAVGGSMASNKVSTQANAYVADTDNTDSLPTTTNVSGNVTVSATDEAGIYANTKLTSSASTSNDGGASILDDFIDDFTPADFDTTDGVRDLEFGDRVRLTNDYAVADFNTDPDFGLTTNFEDVTTGDFVEVLAGHTAGGEAGSIYIYTGADANLDLADINYDTNSDWQKVGGTAGNVYEYLGNATTGVSTDLGTEDYTNLDFWVVVPQTDLIPQGNNISDSNAIAIGGMLVVNDLRTEAEAHITDTTVTASTGDISVTATENATIQALTDSIAEAGGGSAYGSGTVVAANGVIASNLILSNAQAWIDSSTVTATLGSLTLDAQNISSINAETLATTTSGDQAYGVVLAFNTLGWNANELNIFLNTATDLLTNPASVLDNFDNEEPATVAAYINNSEVTVGTDLSVTATSNAQVNALVSNESTSAAAALVNANGQAAGLIFSSNKVSSTADAYIQETGTSNTVTAGNNITVTATDSAGIDADISLLAESSTTNDAGLSILGNLIDTLTEDYQYTTNSGTQSITDGDKVYIASDYAVGGTPAAIYIYTGNDAELNLDSINYATDSNWAEVSNTNVLSDAYNAVSGVVRTNVTDSNSIAIGGVITFNDVRAVTNSYLDGVSATATSGNIEVTALETAIIDATTDSVVTSDGGSITGGGFSIAVNGVIASNVILNQAQAYIQDSDITLGGTLGVEAQNTADINALIESDTEAKGTAVGVVLAFNAIGTNLFDLLVTPINDSNDTETSDRDGDGNDDLDDSVYGSILNALTVSPASVKAYIDNSAVTAGGAIDVNALSNATVVADQGTSATSFNISLGSSVAASVAANLALNFIETDTQAYIDTAAVAGGNTDAIVANGGDITIKAQDTSAITTDVSASSLSVAGGSGTSVSLSVGAAIAVNNIDSDVLAEIRGPSGAAGTPISASGDIVVSALGDSTLDVSAIATALSVSGSTSSSIGVAGAGALGFNNIANDIEALITDGADVTATNLSLTATDASTILTDTGGYAIAASLGASSSGAVSIGLSLAENEINNRVKAAIEGISTTVATTGTVDVLATTTAAEITAQAFAGGVAVGLGATGIAGAGSGAVTLNSINNVIEATIQAGATVEAGGNINLTAKDQATITADAGSVAASLSAGGKLAVGASVGLGFADNAINTTTQAYIDNATVNATGGNLTLSADSDATIDSLAVAIAGAFSIAGKASVALAGAGADATNTITSTTQTYIQNDSDVDASGAVALTAIDDSTITADVGSVAFSASGGIFSGSVAIGLTFADNNIQNSVLAYVGQDSSAGTDTTTINAGSVNLSADSTSTINTIGVAVSFAAAVSIGGSLAGGGTEANNDTRKTVEAFIRNGSTVTTNTGAVNLSAADTSTSTATVGSAGVSAGLVGGSVGVSIVYTTLANTVRTYIDEAQVTAATDLNLDATATATNEATGIATAFALGLSGAFGGAGAEASATESTVVESFINDTATGDNPDIVAQNISLNAIKNVNANYAETFGTAASLGTGISLAVGVSVPTVTLGGAARAYISGADVDASGAVSLDAAVITPTVDQGNDQGVFTNAVGVAASGGTAAVSTVVNQATVTVNPTIETYISSGADITAINDIALTTEAQLDADVEATGISVAVGGLSFAVNATLADIDINPDVYSSIQGSSVTSNTGNISLQSAHNFNAATDSERTGYGANASAIAPITLGITAAGTGADADAISTANVDTYIDSTSSLNAGGSITVESLSFNDGIADASGLTIAGGVGVGTSLADVDTNGTTQARLDGLVTNGTNLTIRTVNTSEADADAEASGGSLLATGQGAVATANASPTLVTRIGNGTNAANVNVSGDISVLSQSETDADAVGSTFSIAGGASVGVVLATATTSPDLDTYVGAGSSVTTTNGSFTLESAHNYSPGAGGSIVTGGNNYNVDGYSSGQAKGAHADAEAAGAAIGASVASTTSTATANANVQTYIESDNTNINAANGTLTLRSRANNDADAASDGEGNSGIASVGDVDANADADGITQAYTNGTSSLTINAGNLTVLATGTNDADASTNSAANSGFASVTDNDSIADASPTVTAAVAGNDSDANVSNIIISGTASITAAAWGDVDADSGSKSGAIAGVSSSVATARWRPTVTAEVTGSSTELEASDIAIQAYNNYNESGTVQAANEARANADSTGEGVAGIAGADANIITNSNVQARIGSGVDLTVGTNLDVTAKSRNNGGGKADNEASGVAGIGYSELDADMASNTQAYVQDSTSADPGSITSTGSGTFQFFTESDNEFFDSGSSDLSLGTNALTGAGGLVGVGGSKSSVELNNPKTKAGIGNHTNINASDATLEINAENNALLGVRTDGEAIGFLGGFNEAEAIARINNAQTEATIGDDVDINVSQFSMLANDKDIDVRAEAFSNVGGLGGDAEATTEADAILNASANIGKNTTITAPQKITIKATAEAVKTRSDSDAVATAGGAIVTANANSDKDVSTDIHVDNDGSEIATSELEVLAIAPPNDDGGDNLWAAETTANAETILGTLIDITEGACEVVGEVVSWGASLVGEEVDIDCEIDNPEETTNSSGTQNTASSITFNADIRVLNVDGDAILEVDESGVVQQLDGVTATNNGNPLAVGSVVDTSAPIVVDEVINETTGTVLLQSNRGGTAGYSNIFFDTALENVDILNASVADLEIINLDPSPNNTEPDVQELGYLNDLLWDYSISTEDNDTNITIDNSNTAGGDVTLLGEIANPQGLTTINSAGGSLRQGTEATFYTFTTSLQAGNTIGTGTNDRFEVLLVITDATDIPSVQQASGDAGVYLKVQPISNLDTLTTMNLEVSNLASTAGDVDVLLSEGSLISIENIAVDATTGELTYDLVSTPVATTNIDLGSANVAGDLKVNAGTDNTVTTNVEIVDTLTTAGTTFLTVLDAITASAGIELAGGGAVLTADTIAALDTALDNLEATAANSGITITETEDLTIGRLTDMVGITALGDVSITTLLGQLSIFEDITATENVATSESGNLTLTATDTNLRNTDLLYIQGKSSLVADGDVTLSGGDQIVLEVGSSITANGSLTVAVDTGDSIDFGDSTVVLSGQLSASSASVTGNNDRDLLRLERLTTNVGFTVSGFDGEGDNLYGTTEADTLTTTAGDDVLDGGAGNDILSSGDGDDTLRGDEGDDTLDGGTGNDTLAGGIGNDSLTGGSGDDTLEGGAGSDILAGGADTDTVSYDSSSAGVVVNLATSTASGGDAEGDTISGFENIIGSDFADTLTGDATANELTGNSGNDNLIGGDGQDILRGGGNDDNLEGGLGNDTLYGDSGNDTFVGVDPTAANPGQGEVDTFYEASGFDIYILGAGGTFYYDDGDNAANGSSDYALINSFTAGSDTIRLASGFTYYLADAPGGTVAGATGLYVETNGVTGYGNTDELIAVLASVPAPDAPLEILVTDYTGDASEVTTATLETTIVGPIYDNEIVGTSSNDVLYGTGFNDRVTAGDGNDYVRGRDGDDLLEGGAGNDRLYGDNGDDILDGGTGDDTLIGGNGADTIYGGEGNEYIRGGSGNDIIIGVDESSATAGRGEIDKIYGDSGADTFVLGANSQVYYDDGDATSQGLSDYALIYDYDETEDSIQLTNSGGGQYYRAAAPSGMGILSYYTAIYFDSDGDGLDSSDEVIAILYRVTAPTSPELITAATLGFVFDN